MSTGTQSLYFTLTFTSLNHLTVTFNTFSVSLFTFLLLLLYEYRETTSTCSECTWISHSFTAKQLNTKQSCSFLPCNGICYGPVSVYVCLSVCLSQVGVLLKTAKHMIVRTKQRDIPGDSSFLMPKILAKFLQGHPQRNR